MSTASPAVTHCGRSDSNQLDPVDVLGGLFAARGDLVVADGVFVVDVGVLVVDVGVDDPEVSEDVSWVSSLETESFASLVPSEPTPIVPGLSYDPSPTLPHMSEDVSGSSSESLPEDVEDFVVVTLLCRFVPVGSEYRNTHGTEPAVAEMVPLPDEVNTV
ncbi:hypothetical protein PInf_021626 [Phytophthora infestans]|nr:hypothetical protein PInf_021626 [Phytophthora infestans]